VSFVIKINFYFATAYSVYEFMAMAFLTIDVERVTSAFLRFLFLGSTCFLTSMYWMEYS